MSNFRTHLVTSFHSRFFDLRLSLSSAFLHSWQKSVNLSRRYFRRLSLELLFLLPLGLLVIIMINLLAPRSSFEVAKVAILTHPQDSRSHLALAKILLASNNLSSVEWESSLSGNGSSAQQLLVDLQKLKNDPIILEEAISQFQKLSEDFPNYRDAYLELAILNFRANRLFAAQKYLSLATTIDPNNPFIQQIQYEVSPVPK